MDFRQLPEPVQRHTHIVRDRVQRSVSGPEEKSRVGRGQGSQCLGRLLVEQYLEPYTVLQHSEREVASVERRPLESGHIRNAQARVQQGIDQRPGPPANVVKFARVVGADLAAGVDQLHDLLSSEGLGGQFLGSRHLQLRGRVPCDPAPALAPGQERTNGLQFFTPRPRLNTAAGTVGVQGDRIQRVNFAAGEVGEVSQRATVAVQRRGLEVATSTVGQKRGDRGTQQRPGRLILSDSHFQLGNLAEGTARVSGAETPSHPHPIQFAVTPHRTQAESVSLPFSGVRTRGQVTALRGQHSACFVRDFVRGGEIMQKKPEKFGGSQWVSNPPAPLA